MIKLQSSWLLSLIALLVFTFSLNHAFCPPTGLVRPSIFGLPPPTTCLNAKKKKKKKKVPSGQGFAAKSAPQKKKKTSDNTLVDVSAAAASTGLQSIETSSNAATTKSQPTTTSATTTSSSSSIMTTASSSSPLTPPKPTAALKTTTSIMQEPSQQAPAAEEEKDEETSSLTSEERAQKLLREKYGLRTMEDQQRADRLKEERTRLNRIKKMVEDENAEDIDLFQVLPAPLLIFIDRFLKGGLAITTVLFVLAGLGITVEAWSKASNQPLPPTVDRFIVEILEPNFTPGLLVLLAFSITLGLFAGAQLGSSASQYKEGE